MTTVEPPAKLPVDHLSASSISSFIRCPEQWKRRYLDREYDPPSAKMILGSAAHASEAQHYGRLIEGGEGLSTDEVLDEFSSEWEDRISREDVDFEGSRPGTLKDSGVAALEVYHRLIVPSIVPESVERKFEFRWPGLDWSVIGYLDLEEADGAVSDLKMTGQRWSSGKADVELSPTFYLAARRAEGRPATEFRFHTLVRSKVPQAEVVPTTRTDRQLDLLTDRIFSVAAEMAWRTEHDVWRGAQDAWMCRGCRAANCTWRLA